MHYVLCTLFCLLDTKNRLRRPACADRGSSMGILSILRVQINGSKKTTPGNYMNKIYLYNPSQGEIVFALLH